MGLSRLSNFIKSVRGTILYVDPNSLDSTDSVENNGNSLTRPFKTIQRALIESVKFSYQTGQNNDRFNKTTILVYPGDHLIDNRPGYIPVSSTNYLKRSGSNVSNLVQWDLNSVFDLTNPNNELYKLNSIHGGVIVPRGVSIVGMDLRKTKIRPLYVPDPENDNIERSCIFRVTGGCYFWQFTILDSDPNGNCYKNYTDNLFVPNFSHHKLSAFEYADGVNKVYINDTFLNGSNKINVNRTDLDMYYEKISVVYQDIQPNYGEGVIDIQPVVDEYRIVGSKGLEVGISTIKAGGGTPLTATNVITVDLVDSVPDLNVDTPIQISGVSNEYDGQYVVSSVINSKQIKYRVQNVPQDPNPTFPNATLNVVVDTVTSTSPYIFNISLRSVYGMCGLLADGDKATGFKSMVVAQFTGIGLQKDENAFTKYNQLTGEYEYANKVSNLHTNSKSRFRPEYENFHIKSTNDSFLQLVSIFAIGYAQHFVTDNGGDIALNNSNSNFGSKALVSSGFKRSAFPQDEHGFITHVISPKEIDYDETSVEFVSVDVQLTLNVSAGAATTDRLYLYNETNLNQPPKVLINGYHIGARKNEKLFIESYVNESIETYDSFITMQNGIFGNTQVSSEKVSKVGRSSVGINSINVDGTDVLTLTQSHSFLNGESVRVISDDASLPDGIKLNQIYYVITNNTLGSDKIKLAKTYNDALNQNSFALNQNGGTLSIISKVSDKNPGDPGHPVQWDTLGNWYINVKTSENKIYDIIKLYGTFVFGNATPRGYVKRNSNRRSLVDSLYRVRYVIPKDSLGIARPPVEGFILQESNDIIGTGDGEISQLFNFTSGSITNASELRNSKFIADASYALGVVTVRTELRHNLKIGDTVEIVNIKSSNNISGEANLGYNGTYKVTSLPSAKEFTYSLSENPGVFLNNTSSRNTSLPYIKRKKYQKIYQVYRTQEIQPYVESLQDGVYYLTLINHSNYPSIPPFDNKGYAQPIVELYPQFDRDNIASDPSESISYALPDSIGEVVIDDLQNSITKETIQSFAVGCGITNIISTDGNNHKLYTLVDHGLSAITSVSIVNSGTAYGTGSSGVLYNAKLVGYAGSVTGSNATAKITLGPGGTITDINIIDGGSAYGIGNTLTVVGVATTAGHVIGVVRVESITNNNNDIIQISGVKTLKEYNNLYHVSSVSVGKPKEINLISSNTISNFSTSGIGKTLTSSSGYSQNGKLIEIDYLNYNTTDKLATLVFSQNHGLIKNEKIRISGANELIFNGDFIIKDINSLSSLVVDIGITTTSTSATGSLYGYRVSLSSHGGDLTDETENTSGRLIYDYAGITASLSSQLSSGSTSDTLVIPNATLLGLNLGDYLQVNNEIFRIKSAVTSNNVSVFRSILGSPRQTHVIGSIVRRINIKPVELRRNSIIRASGHTFEYLGFGPGNYSTSLPEKQDRLLTNYEKFLAQSTKSNGGVIVYTGMNGEGDFFAGNKKINSVTGKEETFDTPFPTNTGEKELSNTNVTETQKLFVNNSIRVDGGKDKNTVSEFDGPVIFTNKVTSSSDIEAGNILIQGNQTVSRKLSVSDSLPSYIGNYGDIVFNASPGTGDNVGWIYSTDNSWTEFGSVSPTDTSGIGIFKQVAIATNNPLSSWLRVGAGSSLVVIDNNGRVGIATNPDSYKLNVSGSVRADYLYGDGSNLTNLPGLNARWTEVDKGIYNTGLTNVGIGTTDPISKLTVIGDVAISGKIGIGTTAPVSTLDVVGSIKASSSVKIGNLSLNPSGSNTLNFNLPNSYGTSGQVLTSDGAGNLTFNTVSVSIAATSANTPNTVVSRNNFGDFNASTITVSNLNATSAVSGNSIKIGNSTLRPGSSNNTLTFNLPNSYGTSGQVLTSDGAGNLSFTSSGSQNLSYLSFGSYLSASSNYNGSLPITVSVNASTSGSSNIVARDSSGNFSAGSITASSLTSNGDINLAGELNLGLPLGNKFIDFYTGTGSANLRLSDSSNNLDTAIVMQRGGSVSLYYNNSPKLYTNNTGASVEGTLSATTLQGNGTIPIGGIIMWSGSTTPAGWSLCNGSNGTPDLRDRFIIGAGSAYGAGATGGSKDAIVVSHTHTASSDSQGGHTHRIRASDNNGNTTDRLYSNTNKAVAGDELNGGGYTTNGGNSVPIIEAVGSHNHNITVNSTGSSGTNANLPPYYALAFIMRIS